jgi:hypothetical protein
MNSALKRINPTLLRRHAASTAKRRRRSVVGDTIAFVLRNLPAILLVLALILGPIFRGPESVAGSILSWILLLPIGVTGIWAAIFRVFFPHVAAADIGWQTSPFQFEVEMADLAIGVTACAAFRRTVAFKEAAVIAASISLLGDAVGHVHQMLAAGNFAPGNAGVPFFTDIICPVLAIVLLLVTYPRRPGQT